MMNNRPIIILTGALILAALAFVAISVRQSPNRAQQSQSDRDSQTPDLPKTQSEELGTPTPELGTSSAVTDDLVSTVRRVDKQSRPSETLAVAYAELRRSAESGDAGAALSLAKGLGDCATTPRTDSEYQDALAKMQQSVTTPAGVFIRDLEAATRSLKKEFNYCRGIADWQLEETAYWLVKAAEGGSLEAKTFFLSTAIPFQNSPPVADLWKDDDARVSLGLDYLAQAASSGVIDAMALYGMYLSDGQIAKDDNIEAAAYLYAASLALGNSDSSSRYNMLAERVLAELYPADVTRAKEKGLAMVEAKNCCITFQ